MKGKNDEVDVNKEDQGYINEFSRIYAKSKSVEAEIKKINETMENLVDADAAINENLGGIFKLSLGETFVLTDEDQAKEYVQRMKTKQATEKADLMAKFDLYKKRIDEIKIILYAKFEKRLRLEED